MSRNLFPIASRFSAGSSSCSMSILVWSVVGCLLMIPLFSLICQSDVQNKEMRSQPLLLQLEEVEEENIKMPRPRKWSPRAAKRKSRRTPTVIDEFLDESSQIRHIFFPDMKTAIDPNKDARNDSLYYYPGRMWLDTDGNPIQAHGGGVLFDERSRTYYWYGEFKDGPTYHAHKRGAARMGGKNYGICHSCRDPGHWLDDCPTKQRCPRCGEGFVRLLEVEKMGDSRGKLFFSCTRRNCRYFDWKKEESSTGAQMETNIEADMEELTRLMKTCARVTKEDDVDVNLITFRKSKGKGKEKIED